MPAQPVVLSNLSSKPARFLVTADPRDAASAVAGSSAAAVRRLLEVRPVRGLLAPGQEQQLQVHLEQDSTVYSSRPVDARYKVVVSGQYAGGGELAGDSTLELPFTAQCLTDM